MKKGIIKTMIFIVLMFGFLCLSACDKSFILDCKEKLLFGLQSHIDASGRNFFQRGKWEEYNKPAEGTTEEPAETSTLKQGTYTTDDGLTNLILCGDNQFIFNRHIATSFQPLGNYVIENGKLILKTKYNNEFIFTISNGQLIFMSGQLAEPFIPEGTVFTLTD